MYIVSEALLVFTFLAEDNILFKTHQWQTFLIGCLAFAAATWQYAIVRFIDAEFRNYASKLIPEKVAEKAVVTISP